MIIAVPLGILSAVKRNSVIDYAYRLGALLGVSMPNFWLGLLLIIMFSLKLNLFSVTGYGELKHLVLPSVTLGIGMVSITTRIMRVGILEVLHQDYILTARSKGLTEKEIIWRHALPNALIPVVTIIGLQFGHLLGGSIIVAAVFTWPGIGKLLMDSILAKDIPVVQGCVLLMATMYTLVNLLVDLSYALLNPKIRQRGYLDA
ncbi:MAG: ABC transporter permease [Bacillota bacterium]